MASEQVLDVLVRRHIINSDRPFSSVLEGYLRRHQPARHLRASALIRKSVNLRDR